MNRLVYLTLITALLQIHGAAQHGGHFTFEGERHEVTSQEIEDEISLLFRLSGTSSEALQVEQAWARIIRRKAARQLKLTLSPEAFDETMEARHAKLRVAWMVDGKVDKKRLADYLSLRGFDDLQSYEEFCRDEFLMELFLEREFPVAALHPESAWLRFQADHALLKIRTLVFSEETAGTPIEVNLDREPARGNFFKWWNQLPKSIKMPFDDESRPAIETEALSVVFSRYTPDQFQSFFEKPRTELKGKSFADLTANITLSAQHERKMKDRWQRYRRTLYGRIERTLPRGLTDDESFTVIQPHLRREYRMIRYLERIWLDLNSRTSFDLRRVGEAAGLEWRRLPMARIDQHINDRELYGDHPLHMWKLSPGLFNNSTDPNNPGHTRYARGLVDQPGGHASIFVIRRAEPMQILTAEKAIDVKRARETFKRTFRWSETQKRIAVFAERLHKGAQQHIGDTTPTFAEAQQARGAALREIALQTDDAKWMGPFYIRAADVSRVDAVRSGPLGRRVANALQRSYGKMLQPGRLPSKGDGLRVTSCTNQRVGLVAEILDVTPPSRSLFRMQGRGRDVAEDTLTLEQSKKRGHKIRLVYSWPNIVKKFKIVSPEFDRIMGETLKPRKQKTTSQAEPTREETLRTRLAAGRYRTLNPVTYRSQGEYNALRFLLNPYLLKTDPDTLELQPYLAESLPTISEDGLTHTWTLRRAQWSDGRPVTSDDAVFTWSMIQHPRVPAPQLAGAIGDIIDVQRIDDRRFSVTYKKRYFRASCSFGLLFGIVPAHASPSDPDEFARATQLIGCGPYSIKRWNEKELVADKVANWWGASLPEFKNRFQIRRIVHRFIDDSLQLSLQLKSGEIDLAALGGADDYIRWKKDPTAAENFESTSYYLPGSWSYIGWNCEDPLFKDRNVRRALAHLAPRREVNQNAHGGLARLVTGPFPKGSPLEDASIEPIRFSYRRAESLLKAAGWRDTDGDGVLDRDGRPFAFELLRPKGDASWMRIIEVYRQRLSQVGIQMTLRQVDFRALLDRCPKHDFQAYALIWRVDAVATDLFDLFHSSQAKDGNNWQNFKNTKIDDLLQEFRTTRDDDHRASLGQSIHRLIVAEQPVCFLFASPSCVVWNKRVKGVLSHPLGLREWDMYLEAK